MPISHEIFYIIVGLILIAVNVGQMFKIARLEDFSAWQTSELEKVHDLAFIADKKIDSFIAGHINMMEPAERTPGMP